MILSRVRTTRRKEDLLASLCKTCIYISAWRRFRLGEEVYIIEARNIGRAQLIHCLVSSNTLRVGSEVELLCYPNIYRNELRSCVKCEHTPLYQPMIVSR